jgi:hypothetical protein
MEEFLGHAIVKPLEEFLVEEQLPAPVVARNPLGLLELGGAKAFKPGEIQVPFLGGSSPAAILRHKPFRAPDPRST